MQPRKLYIYMALFGRLLNRSKLRTETYERIAVDLSQCMGEDYMVPLFSNFIN